MRGIGNQIMVVGQVPSDTQKGKKPELPGQVVLVLQGGGALGAYQVGVYEALHEARIEPDWVIGTSIGAINGAIIAGNTIQQRMDRLRKFWTLIESGDLGAKRLWPWIGNWTTNLKTLLTGIRDCSRPTRQQLGVCMRNLASKGRHFIRPTL